MGERPPADRDRGDRGHALIRDNLLLNIISLIHPIDWISNGRTAAEAGTSPADAPYVATMIAAASVRRTPQPICTRNADSPSAALSLAKGEHRAPSRPAWFDRLTTLRLALQCT